MEGPATRVVGKGAQERPTPSTAPRSRRRSWRDVVLAPVRALIRRPSNDRDWAQDLAVLPYADIEGNTVTVRNVRNCAYTSTRDFVLHHYDRRFLLDDLVSV